MDAKNYVFERVYVETPVDTDKDGKLDLIAVYIKRPKSTDLGLKVPAIFVANPYLMTCNEDWYVPHDVDQDIKVYPKQHIDIEQVKYDKTIDRTSKVEHHRVAMGEAKTAEIAEDVEFECISDVYDYFIDKDYAAVYSGGLGTLGSEGVTLTGSREEVLAFKAVIDWLNGRSRAFTDKESNIEIKAWWCTGNVAMNAKSYLGTMCIGVATTGVEGLKTIIPEAAISNWYNYYRSNGLNLPALGWQGDDLDILAKYCNSRAKDDNDFKAIEAVFKESQQALISGEDRDSGNYNKFWDERNYLNWIDDIKASVFIIHGINDWNVKTNQCIPFFKALEKHNVPRKMFLHQGEHIYIYDLKASGTKHVLERWLDHYLKGVDNGIEKEPTVMVESNLDQELWYKSESWPVCTEMTVLPVTQRENVTINDDLSISTYRREDDNLMEWRNQLVLDDDIINKVKYVFEIKENMRFSGTCSIEFDCAIDKKTAILSAMLVDIGEERRITNEEIKDGNEFYFGIEKEPSPYKVITRNSMNAQNRTSIYAKEEIIPGDYYHYKLELVPTDYTIKQGHKLALILYGIDPEQTQRPFTATNITFKKDSIIVKCPLVPVE